MDRRAKEKLVALVREIVTDHLALIVVKNRGLTVGEQSSLHRSLKLNAASMRVTPNRLLKLALQGTEKELLANFLEGPSILAWSNDPVAVTKGLVTFADTHDSIEIRGGVLGGAELDTDAISTLAKLPSLDVLRGQLAGLLVAPMSKIARIMCAPATNLARMTADYGSGDRN